MKYSIVLPVYNEENIISRTIENIIEVFMREKLDYEIITVDDGSTDDSAAVLKDLQNKYPQQSEQGLKTLKAMPSFVWTVMGSMTQMTFPKCFPTWRNMIFWLGHAPSKRTAPGIATWLINSTIGWLLH